MSNHVSSEVLKRQLNTLTRKAVMHLLADKASDNGSGIWASKQTMADELCTSKQTILTTIRGLVDDGLLKEVGHRRCANGYLVEYCIDVGALKALPLVKAHQRDQSSSLTGQATLPVKHLAPTSQAALPDQSSSLTQTTLEPSLNQSPLPPASGGRKIRTTISDDWKVPELGSLPDNAKAFALRWPAGAYAAQAEAFERYHRGTGTRRADWDALWAAWVSNKHEAVMRQGKAGVVFASPAAATGSSPGAKPAPKRPAAAKADEDDRSRTLHATLREQIGQMLWEQWFGHTALIFADDHLTVAAPSQFVSGWLEERMRQNIDKALAHLGWHIDQIYHRVSPPKRGKSAMKAKA